MILPPLLKSGDTVALVATARNTTSHAMEQALKLLGSWGLKMKEGANLYAADNQFAGTDKQRAADLQQALDDEKVKAVFFARGGYGTVRIIDAIDFSAFRKNPKWLIGFSDVTVIHAHVNRTTDIATLHAPLAVTLPDATESVKQHLRDILFNGQVPAMVFPTHPLNRMGDVAAEVVGGNLSVLCSLSGSASALKTDGKILFLEDVGEYRYHLDRMMMLLKRSEMLHHLKGLVVGAMTDINDYSGYPVPFGKDAYQIIASHLTGYDYPVCYGFPAGHIADNHPLLIGGTYRLSVNANTVRLGGDMQV